MLSHLPLIQLSPHSILINMSKTVFCLPLLFMVLACGSADNAERKNSKIESFDASSKFESNERQLNINVLWDLSDRIDENKNPSSPAHYQRDIEAINSLVTLFKKDMQEKGAYKAKSK